MNMSMDMPAIIGLGGGYLNGFSGLGRSLGRAASAGVASAGVAWAWAWAWA
jgi:hypothetical protein